MALSNSFDFSQNGDELIKDALVEAGIVEPSETPHAETNDDARRTLNRMLKTMQADGLQLWCHRPATLFLQKGTNAYDIGPTGYHCTENTYVETAIRTAASSGATTMEVDSTTGITAADYIGVQLDDGSMHWTTVSSVTDSDTLVLTSAITDDAAVDNVIYAYTSKVQRPLKVIQAVLHDHGGIDTDLTIVSRQEYWAFPDKTTNGEPYTVQFEPYLTNSKLRVYQPPSNSIDTMKLILHFPFDDIDAASNNFFFPQEWYEPIHYGLSMRLAVKWGAPSEKKKELAELAAMSKAQALTWDRETVSLFLQPAVG